MFPSRTTLFLHLALKSLKEQYEKFTDPIASKIKFSFFSSGTNIINFCTFISYLLQLQKMYFRIYLQHHLSLPQANGICKLNLKSKWFEWKFSTAKWMVDISLLVSDIKEAGQLCLSMTASIYIKELVTHSSICGREKMLWCLQERRGNNCSLSS